MAENVPKVALMWHGDRAARDAATFSGKYMNGVAEALRAVGIAPEPAVYSDAMADEVRAQCRGVDGVLVWVNPIEGGRDRTVLDGLLRDVAAAGVFVSAHPDIILELGTKDVLYQTRGMSWGCGGDIYRYATPDEFRAEFPARLAAGKPRVLKQYRGNGGNGVWKVEAHPGDPARVRVHHALRGSVEQDVSLDEFLAQCASYFAGPGGHLIDQPYQERLVDGMVRCYLVGDRVAGFGHQAINALFPAPPGAAPEEAPAPTPRLYHPPDAPEFQAIRRKMETEWLPDLCRTLGLAPGSLPIIWDADLLFGPKTDSGADTYVLCEINVSAVSPFPDSAFAPLAEATKERLAAASRAAHSGRTG